MMKAVIFDLDGVLVSTDELHYQGWKSLADRECIYFDREINNRLRGVSRMESLEIILERAEKEYSDSEKQEMASYKNGVYAALLDSLTPADRLEGVTACLAELKKAGYKLAIGSSSKNTPKILERTGLRSEFDASATATIFPEVSPTRKCFSKRRSFSASSRNTERSSRTRRRALRRRKPPACWPLPWATPEKAPWRILSWLP